MIKQPHKLSPAMLPQVWAWANLRVDALSWACLGRADCCCLLVSCTPGGLLRAPDILTSRPSQASLRPAHVRRRHAAPGLRRVGCWCSLCAHEPRLVLALAPNLGSCTDNKNRQGSSTNRIVPSKLWSKITSSKHDESKRNSSHRCASTSSNRSRSGFKKAQVNIADSEENRTQNPQKKSILQP